MIDEGMICLRLMVEEEMTNLRHDARKLTIEDIRDELTESSELNVLVSIATHSKEGSKDIHKAVLIGLVAGQPRLKDNNALKEAVHIFEEDNDKVIVGSLVAACLSYPRLICFQQSFYQVSYS